MGKALGGTGPGPVGRGRPGSVQVVTGASMRTSGRGKGVCTHSMAFCRAALMKSWASSVRWVAMGLLQDTRPSRTFRRVARSLSPANGDEQVRLKAET